MSDCVVAYVPVLHEGYRRFLETHAAGREVFLIGPELYVDFRPLAKDIRALDAGLVAKAIAAWGIASSVAVLDVAGAEALAERAGRITLPDEDVSHQVVERFFPRAEVAYDTVFLRWDKTRTVKLLRPEPHREGLSGAEAAAARSIDWWRQVGAALESSRMGDPDGDERAPPAPPQPVRRGRPAVELHEGRRLRALDRDARRGAPDRRGGPRRPRDRRRRHVRDRLPVPAVREAHRRRGDRPGGLPRGLRGARRPGRPRGGRRRDRPGGVACGRRCAVRVRRGRCGRRRSSPSGCSASTPSGGSPTAASRWTCCARELERLLARWGVAEPEVVAGHILYADLHGIESHGVAMLRHYATGHDLRAVPEVVGDSVIDAGGGIGHLAADRAMRLAIEKARAAGVGVVAVRNSGHFGAAGSYAALARDEGLIGLALTNTRDPAVVPTFGADAEARDERDRLRGARPHARHGDQHGLPRPRVRGVAARAEDPGGLGDRRPRPPGAQRPAGGGRAQADPARRDRRRRVLQGLRPGGDGRSALRQARRRGRRPLHARPRPRTISAKRPAFERAEPTLCSPTSARRGRSTRRGPSSSPATPSGPPGPTASCGASPSAAASWRTCGCSAWRSAGDPPRLRQRGHRGDAARADEGPVPPPRGHRAPPRPPRPQDREARRRPRPVLQGPRRPRDPHRRRPRAVAGRRPRARPCAAGAVPRRHPRGRAAR